MKKIFFPLLFLASVFCFYPVNASQILTIKYRQTPVDVSDFEYQDTSKSSWIRGIWYDKRDDYLIINLNGINYHYCGVPDNVWSAMKNPSSYGRAYSQYLKGRFDCRFKMKGK